MASNPKPKLKKGYTKSVTSFEGFLHQLKTNHESHQDVQCDGFAHFLKYDLGNLNKLIKGPQVDDTDASSHIVNRNGEAKAVVNGEEVQVYAKKEGKPVKIYAEDGPDGISYTTVPPGNNEEKDNTTSTQVIDSKKEQDVAEYATNDEKLVPLAIPDYKPTREDYMKVIGQVRLEVKKKIINPISKASGYKWEYSKGHFKDEILLLEFSCFQDVTKDMQPSKFTNRHIVEIYKLGECSSSLNVFINVITRQIRISYRHKSHTKLIDIIYSLLSQIYNE